MECRVCGFEEQKATVYCRDCGERFYEIQDRVVLYQKRRSADEIAFSLHAKNNGDDDLVMSVEDEDLTISPESCRIEYIGRRGIYIVPPGEQDELQFNLSGLRRVSRCQVKMLASIGKALPLEHELSLEVYPSPRILVEALPLEADMPIPQGVDESAILLGPSRGYETRIKLSLENRSYARIDGIEVSYGKADFPAFPVILDGLGASEEFVIDFPSNIAPGSIPEELSIRLTIEGITQPMMEKFALRYRPTYGVRDIVMSQSKWSDDGLDLGAKLEVESLINVPLGRTYQKELFIGMKKQDEAIDAIQVLDLGSSLPDDITISPSERLPFLVPPVLPAQVTFKALSVDVDGDWDIVADIRDYTMPSKTRKFTFPFIIKTVQPEDYPYCIGIDFGTSNSCIALSMPVLGPDGIWAPPDTVRLRMIKTLPLDRKPDSAQFDARVTPSCLDLEPVEWYDAIGWPAKREARSIKEVKRHLMLETAPGTSQQPKEIVTLIIRKLLRRAVSYLDERGIPYSVFRRAVLTVPTTFWPPEIEKLRQACLNAFYDLQILNAEVKIVDESVAALHYLLQGPTAEKVNSDIIIVYDFGGGTTDVTAVLRESAAGELMRYTVIASGGDSKFGGADVNDILGEIYRRNNPEDSGFEDFELLKMRLGDPESWEAYHRNLNRDSLITQLENLIQNRVKMILEDILMELHDKLNPSGASEKMSVQFILAGGSSRLYGFAELVKRLARPLAEQNSFELTDVIKLDSPKQGVSIGAFLSGTWKPYEFAAEHNVTPYSVLWILPKGTNLRRVPKDLRTGHVTLDGEQHPYIEIIKRGAEFPCAQKINTACLGLEGEIPIELYFQLGAGEPERYRTSEMVKAGSTLNITLDENKSLFFD